MYRRSPLVRSFLSSCVQPALLAAATAFLLPAGTGRAADSPNPPVAAELILRGGTDTGANTDASLLSPTAAFELRFAAPMVAADQVGSPAAESPLVIAPPLAGVFRWTSRRGGVFTPSEPPPLGASYQCALRPDLKAADGQPVRASLGKTTFHTPPFQVRGLLDGYPPHEGATTAAGPRVQLLFNAAVDPGKIAGSLSFRNPAGGPPVAAVVAVPKDKDQSPFGPKIPERTWRELFFAAHTPETPKTAGPAVPRATALNRVVVTVASPLPPGKDWKLVAAAGLGGLEPGVRLPAAVEIPIGDIVPFELTELEAENHGADKRLLSVHFSRGLEKEVTPENAARWLHVVPAPADMKFRFSAWDMLSEEPTVEVTGHFETGQDYTVTADAGLFSVNRYYKLAAAQTRTVQFVDETPQIAFPGFSVRQLGVGRREYALNVRNAPEVRLRAKLVPSEQSAQALAAYDKAVFSRDGEYSGSKRVDFDEVPGKVVYEKIVPGSHAKDKPETVALHWDDILGARKHGTILLEAEQPAPTAGQTKRAGAQVFVQVTDLGLVWKTAPGGELLAYVFSLADATPVTRARVSLLDAGGRALATKTEPTASTDAQGIAQLRHTGLDHDTAWLSVTAGDDCYLLPFEQGRRDSLGLYRFHLPATAFQDYYDDQTRDALAGTDATKAPAPPPPRRDVLIFSERGVYKPGEEAHVKAIVREWGGDGLVDPRAGTQATLRAYDAKGRRFWQQDGPLSAGGSISATVPLPKSTLGRYRVEISFDGKPAAENTSSDGDFVGDDADESDDTTLPNVCRFQVQDYQPNAFAVTLARPAVLPVGAGPVAVPLSAHYYMGKVLSHAKTVWSLKATDATFSPEGFDDYVFNNAAEDWRLRQQRGELALDGRGALSAQGEFDITPRIVLNTASPTPRRVRLQASVTDQDQQTVSGDLAFTVHSSDFYLGMRELPEVVRAGDPLPLEVVAVQAADALPCPAPVKVTAKLSRIEWRTNRVANQTGQSDYDNQPHLTPVSTMEVTTTGVRRVGRRWEPNAVADTLLAVAGRPAAATAADGEGNVARALPVAAGEAASLVPPDPGEYMLEVSTLDGAGRVVHTATNFSALGDKEAEWGYHNAWQLPLLADKSEYHAGDRATVLVKTPISGRALVTVEREGVSRAFVTEIAKEHPAVQVPILPGDAPNVFVSVLLLRGAEQSTHRVKEPEYRAGYCQLLVPRTDTRLAVDVRPERPEYQPGEDVAVQVEVTGEGRRPAAGAEVTLYAVDKGVLSLTGYLLPNVLRAFYHARPLDVQTGLTLPDLFSEDPADLNFSEDKGYTANKGYLVGGGGEEGRGDRLRQNFVACAYWNADLVTDAQGRVSAHFPAPDGLTEYEVMAVVHAGGRAVKDAPAAGRFGGGRGAFRINKPLMLEPALPRFGNVGDHVLLRAVVHNQSPVAGEAEVSLDLDDTAAVDNGADTGAAPPRRRVQLAAGESRTVDIPVVFTHAGDAVWTWHARLLGEGPNAPAWRDSVRSTLHVDHPTPRRSELVALRVEDGHAADVLAHVNPELLEGEDGLIRVSLSTTRLGELSEGVDALLEYPYGCVEQTTSSLLPWLVLKNFRNVLPGLRHTPQEVEDVVARGVNKLIGMQTDSGGLAYWPEVTGRDAHPWGSAYGALGLALAQRAGYYVPKVNFNKLCGYLSEHLRSDKADARDTYHEHNETDRCLALYALALAGKSEPAYYEQSFARRDTLSPEDRTLVALAIAESKGPAEMVRALLQPGPRESEGPDGWNAFASESALDGMRLLAWCRFQPQDPAVDKKLNTLLEARTGRGTWETTQGNAWAVLAMSAYAQTVEKPAGAASGTVFLGGVGKPFQIKGKQETFACEFPLTAAVAVGREKLSLTSSGSGNLYLQARVEARPRGGNALAAAPTNGKGGYIIRRQYEKLLDDGSRTDAKSLKVGDRVLVSLEIEAPDKASYVAVNDPLPSVLEAVNPEFKTAGAGGNAPAGGGGWWVSDFRELRTDRAMFFCDHLSAGHFRLQYLARVRAAGTATAPPAKIEEMYHPDHYAETAAASLGSKALE